VTSSVMLTIQPTTSMATLRIMLAVESRTHQRAFSARAWTATIVLSCIGNTSTMDVPTNRASYSFFPWVMLWFVYWVFSVY